MSHGFYTGSQPSEVVQAMLAENIQGVDEEISGLRTLERGLLERQVEARSGAEAVRLGEAYSKAASRMTEVIQAEKEMAEGAEVSDWVKKCWTLPTVLRWKMECRRYRSPSWSRRWGATPSWRYPPGG
jgi:hypothetical protein